MGGVNKVILIGRLGRDPEPRMTQGGTKVSTFSLATDRFHSGNGGGVEKTTDWHRVVAYGKLAEQCNQYLSKGRLVCIEGSLQTRSWEKTPGDRRYATEVIASRVSFLDPKGGGATTQEAEEPQEADAF